MKSRHSRKQFLTTAAASTAGLGAAGMLTMFGVEPARAEKYMREVAEGRRLKAAYSNAGLQATWCAQGRDTALYWGNILRVDVTWYDGQLDATKQRTAIDDMSTKKWDFVAIQADSIGTLGTPVNKMISAGIPVIDVDTLIAPLDSINVHMFIAADNIFMGSAVTQALITAIGGKGNIVETWGAYGHTGAQGRNKGFQATVAKFPGIKVLATDTGNWDVVQTARLWEDWLNKYAGKIDAAFFHNDDMALAAATVIQRHGLTGKIKIGGVDAMPTGINAVLNGSMTATVRNPSCRVHSYAMFAGIAAALNGEKTGSGPNQIPKNIIADGPVVTPANAPGMLWMERHFVM